MKSKKAFYLMLILLIISLVLEGIEIFYAFSNYSMPFWVDWINLVLTTLILCLYGWKFFYWSYIEIFKNKTIGMYTMLSLCVFVSYIFSWYPLIQNTINFVNNTHSHELMSFFPTVAIIISVINLGNYLTTKLEHKAEDDINAIAKLKINYVHCYNLKTKKVLDLAIEKIKVGDYIQIKKGESIPLDSRIIYGTTYVDESSITGETKHIKKIKNNALISGTINYGQTIIACVTKDFKSSTINQIIENVKKIHEAKPKYRRIADKVAKWFVPIVICLAIITFFVQAFVPEISSIFSSWIFGNQKPDSQYIAAIYYAVAVLAVSCPCALGIAIPFASICGVSKASKNGIIINHASAYEKANKIDVVALDKTGTITSGKFLVTKVIGDKKNLKIIYQLEANSIHPLAKSFCFYYLKNNKEVNTKIKVNEIPGVGIKGIINKQEYTIVSYKYLIQHLKGLSISSEIKKYIKQFEISSENDLISLSFLIKNNKVINLIEFKDEIKKDALATINVLKQRGIDVIMLTGDNQKTAQLVANKLNIDFQANMKPTDKFDYIKNLQSQNKKVAYIGDGINDLEAMKQSDLSIAINKENAIINELCDILLLNENLTSLLKAIFLIKLTKKVIILNLLWAFLYNIITIPLTILGYLPAFLAVIAMASSDAFVIINSIFYKTKKFSFLSKKEQNLFKIKKSNDFKI